VGKVRDTGIQRKEIQDVLVSRVRHSFLFFVQNREMWAKTEISSETGALPLSFRFCYRKGENVRKNRFAENRQKMSSETVAPYS
jgi:hypothetical protein